MSVTEIAFAVSLLVAPVGSPLPVIEPEEWPQVQAALSKVAVEWELMDPRESSFMIVRFEEIKEDLEILRKRHVELKGAPLVNDNKRFPERTVLNEMLAFNRALRAHINQRQCVDTDRSARFREALQETDKLFQVWDAVRDAKCEFYYITVRRQALKKVREMVGAEAYYTGNMPHYIPTWRFQEIE